MLNLTIEERKTILFLILVLFIGLGLKFLSVKSRGASVFISFSQDIFKIDLNTADKQTLMDIPGIGEKIAARIIEYRHESYLFNSKEDLRKIKGITESRYQKIKDYFR